MLLSIGLLVLPSVAVFSSSSSSSSPGEPKTSHSSTTSPTSLSTRTGPCGSRWQTGSTATVNGGALSTAPIYTCVDPAYYTTLPFKVVLDMDTGVCSVVSPQDCIDFAFQLFHGSALIAGGQWYPLEFLSSPQSWPSTLSNFRATSSLVQFGDFCTCNSESGMAGSGSRENGNINAISATMLLLCETPTGPWVAKPHAWSAGDLTDETATNIYMSTPKVQTGKASIGMDNLVHLW